jgi:hypothetical protein
MSTEKMDTYLAFCIRNVAREIFPIDSKTCIMIIPEGARSWQSGDELIQLTHIVNFMLHHILVRDKRKWSHAHTQVGYGPQTNVLIIENTVILDT